MNKLKMRDEKLTTDSIQIPSRFDEFWVGCLQMDDQMPRQRMLTRAKRISKGGSLFKMCVVDFWETFMFVPKIIICIEYKCKS